MFLEKRKFGGEFGFVIRQIIYDKGTNSQGTEVNNSKRPKITLRFKRKGRIHKVRKKYRASIGNYLGNGKLVKFKTKKREFPVYNFNQKPP